jgi:hypothetical protein
LVALTLVAFNWSAGRAEGLKKVAREPRRFSFKIEPGTPVKDLLPVLPKYWAMLPGYMCETFEQIPEVTFGDPVAKIADTEKETAHILAKINHLNQSRKDDDAFMKILIGHRAELRGLPFLMGKDCRMETKQAQVFSEAVELVHQAERALRADAFVVPEDYWPTLRGLWDQKDPDIKYHRHDVVKGDGERAQVRALMQVFAIAPETYRVGLAKHLASMQHAEAAHALVQLALYAPEKAVRHAAIDSLKKHPSQDYTRLLVGGFRYPLAAVADRAAEALVRLECKEALPNLVDVLEQPDARAPVTRNVDGREVKVAHELVRVNHHRNCMLCHAPANGTETPRDVLTAPVPLPDRSLGSVSSGYRFDTSPDIFVRIDRTYLRQDFSMMMRVEDASPWPEMQRFDFLVRTRELTQEEADACEKYLARATPPSHIAARHALRELTGHRPAQDTPQVWRRVIEALR